MTAHATTMKLDQPLVLAPLAIDKPRWGSRRFLDSRGFPVPEEAPESLGELWLASDLPGQSTPIIGGRFDGLSLAELMVEAGPEITGQELDPSFPLLVKILAVEGAMSIQVHPDDECARRSGLADRGKYEAWWILEAEAGAMIQHGFKAGCRRRDLDRALSGDGAALLPLLHEHEARRGELLEVPPGTIHGLKGPLLVFEVQDRCNLTFRLYDHGRSTELHHEQAAEVSWQLKSARQSASDFSCSELLVDEGAPFTLESVRLAPGTAWIAGLLDDRPELSVVLEGAVTVRLGEELVELGPGATLLWPARLPAGRLDSSGGALLARITTGSTLTQGFDDC